MFPDPNVGYIFGYKSGVCEEGIWVAFLRGVIRILFRYEDMERVRLTTYKGGRISWDVIRWGKCPRGTRVLEITLKRGIFKRHLIVFEDPDEAVDEIRKHAEVEVEE